jgi:membrane-associated phospholipid phosphatase
VAQSSYPGLQTGSSNLTGDLIANLAGYLRAKRSEWENSGHDDRAILLGIFLFPAVTGCMMLAHGAFMAPDQFFLLALVGIFFSGRAKAFLWDWLPPILLLLGYDSLRGALPDLMHRVHIFPMIVFDRWLFGGASPVLLQGLFFTPGNVHWYDTAAVMLYFLHFLAPMVVALLFWFIDRSLFKKLMASMVILSYLAFIIYYVFPAMPPWMASDLGYLPPVAPILRIVVENFGYPLVVPTVYKLFGANLIAAVPSLHAAFPFMMALFLAEKFPRWGRLAFLYPIAVWLAVVYLGQHYVFDILVAVCLALAVYLVMANWRGMGRQTDLARPRW